MKTNSSILFLILLFIATLVACSGEKKHSEDEHGGGSNTWTEMDSYHMIMAESYHPLKDSANLAPARANAEMLAAEAEKWAAATLPERVNNDEMMTRVEDLKESSRAFADKVKGGASDEELAAALTAIHEQFHAIMEAWEGGGHTDHH